MAKKVREKALDSRAAREKLKISGKPYYRALDPELHLGYRKGKDARRWVARIYLGNGKYRVENIGYADDIADADGNTVLDFWQAQEKARELKSGGAKAKGNGYTVRQAIDDYIVSLEGKPTQYKARQSLAAHVRDDLGDKPVAEISKSDLDAWLNSIVKLPPRARGGLASVDMSDPEVKRRRKSSANRLMNNLRAALNLAFENGKVSSDSEWRRVKPFKGADAARIRYLTVAEAQRLVNSCDPDFRVLVQAALVTGARYGELTRLQVRDFNPDSGTLHIRQSKSGKDRPIVLTEEGVELFSSLAAGQVGSAPLLGREWKDNAQILPMARAVERAKIDPPISFHGLRHTWASLSVMAGLPLMVVARNLGHVDTTMVERHYGHLAPSYIADAIRKHAPRFGGVESNVEAIRVTKRAM